MNHYNISIKDWNQKATALSKGLKKNPLRGTSKALQLTHIICNLVIRCKSHWYKIDVVVWGLCDQYSDVVTFGVISELIQEAHSLPRAFFFAKLCTKGNHHTVLKSPVLVYYCLNSVGLKVLFYL